MKRLLFTLCALAFFATASAQSDSIRKGQKKANKTEKQVGAVKKNDAPTMDTKKGRTTRSTTTNNGTDPVRSTNPPTTPPPGANPNNPSGTPPTSPAIPSNPTNPSNPNPTSPNGQP